MKINAYYSSDIKQHKFRLQYHKYQIHLTFVETMEINGGIFNERQVRVPNYERKAVELYLIMYI